MQCEYRDNASGRTTAAESIAGAWARDGLDVDFREVDKETWRPLTDWQPYRPGAAARFAPALDARDVPSHRPAGRRSRVPTKTQETPTMRIAVKSAGGITESFIHVENVDEGVKEAARQIAEDYALPTDIELWSDNSDGGSPRKLGELCFVAVDGAGNVVELD